MERCSVRRLGGGGNGVEEPRGWRQSARKATTTRVAAGAIHGRHVPAFCVPIQSPGPGRSVCVRSSAAAGGASARVLPRSVRVHNAPGKSATRCAPHATAIRTWSADASTTVQALAFHSTLSLGSWRGAQRQRERRRTGLAVWDGEGLVMLRPQARHACERAAQERGHLSPLHPPSPA